VSGRRTIGRAASLEGVGLHLGVPCRLSLLPAAPGAGIRFRRTDLAAPVEFAATVDVAVLTERRTQLGDEPWAVHTVEHVLSAVAGLEIDDLVIEMDGPEPPIMDGSAAPFLDALVAAGVVVAPGDVERLIVGEPIHIVDGESEYEAHPGRGLEIEVEIDFPHPMIGRQVGRWRLGPDVYARELAGARTFGFVREVEYLRSRGLIKGASTANAVVLDEHGLVDATLRWPDEFVRHKAMDLVGDLALAGARVEARIVARKPSHRGTVLLVRALREAARRS
jgi:UDP-3-O-acyl N-acetylglucosamine deacetylase